jgi:hypothetical protein
MTPVDISKYCAVPATAPGASADRVGHLNHLNVTMRIYGFAVRSNELAWPLALFLGTEAADQVNFQIKMETRRPKPEASALHRLERHEAHMRP